MNTSNRLCVECGETTEHLVGEDPVRCTACGTTATTESLGDCAISYCPNAATHLVVLASGRADRQREQYCESHVGVATDDARTDPTRDVLYGPVDLEFE